MVYVLSRDGFRLVEYEGCLGDYPMAVYSVQTTIFAPVPTPQPTIHEVCPPDVPFSLADKNQINIYCNATSGQACSSPKVWASPLTCHAAPGWKPFGPDCHGPYCDCCLCLSPTPTPYWNWKDCSYCDANNDGLVCRDDLESIGTCFWKEKTDSDWNDSCDDWDMNEDGKINIFDLVRCSRACYNCGN